MQSLHIPGLDILHWVQWPCSKWVLSRCNKEKLIIPICNKPFHKIRQRTVILQISYTMKAMNYQDMIKIKHYNYRKGKSWRFYTYSRARCISNICIPQPRMNVYKKDLIKLKWESTPAFDMTLWSYLNAVEHKMSIYVHSSKNETHLSSSCLSFGEECRSVIFGPCEKIYMILGKD